MELFIDAYDWVMVPNVYGMSQHADGGLITTKPYISGSSYVLKMSNFRKGPWCAIWDALYWRFIDRHRDFFAEPADVGHGGPVPADGESSPRALASRRTVPGVVARGSVMEQDVGDLCR